ncbi:ABC transporter permease [Halobacillus salinus]|uniref:ABC transporter permease n=1 Tax=Halobacillus salinus TaxID=192814 RepID=UPI0009A63823|nr:ABC transporter permease [Halobacillus salinus]
MTLNQLIWKSLKKNLSNYYLYVFALIFSVALFFAFVTMNSSPDTGAAKETTTGSVGLTLASIVLTVIVTVFLLYANRIFIKRRSKEIGLFQLIGMTKRQVFRVLSMEHFLLYFGAMVVGIGFGFLTSRLLELVLLNVTGQEGLATLSFSMKALLQTILFFSVVYGLIMLSNALYIRKRNILDLFQVRSKSEGKRVSVIETIMGIFGLVLIGTGYYVSSIMFRGDMVRVELLFGIMLFILATVILGTYLFYKGSVSFLGNLIRKQKAGYLHVREVLSLSSILFRMKSNALMLTVITTVSALAISLLSLSYITYYSAEETAMQRVAGDFAFLEKAPADAFTAKLEENGIAYERNNIDIVKANINVKDIVQAEGDFNFNSDEMLATVISDEDVPIDVAPEDTVFSGTNDLMSQLMSLKTTGEISFEEVGTKQLTATQDDYFVSNIFTSGGLPTAVVDQETFERLNQNKDPELQWTSSLQVTVNMEDSSKVAEANKLFGELPEGELPQFSRIKQETDQKQSLGLTLFIIGFLGLTFLITSGCILYFKQMDESEDERSNYTILRKIGYTRNDLLQGIRLKQLFNFGIPLAVGLLHSYFAVKSGWFIFGTELWTPMLIVMGLYALFYSIFGVLSIQYYKKVIRESL